MSKNSTRRSFLISLFLVFSAVILVVGFHSTQTFAAENDATAEEVLLYSDLSVPVEEEITQADYEKMENQFNIHPDGEMVIESKTVENETVVTQTEDNHIKTKTTKTTGWVVRDVAPASPTTEKTETPEASPLTQGSSLESALPKLNNNDSNINVALAIPAIVAAAPVIAVVAPAAIAVAIPAILVGSLANRNSSNNRNTTSDTANLSQKSVSNTTYSSASHSVGFLNLV